MQKIGYEKPMEMENENESGHELETILPRWSKKAFRGLVQGHRKDGKSTTLARHVHEMLYDVLEAMVERLIRGFAMERNTCPPGMSDVDVVEHVIRYDAEMNVLLADLPVAREQWNRWKQAEDDQLLKALPHYRMKNPLKRAIRNVRRTMGAENPRVMMDLVAFLLIVLETWLGRIALGTASLSAVTRRTTVTLTDMRLILSMTLPSQVWVTPILDKKRIVIKKKLPAETAEQTEQ